MSQEQDKAQHASLAGGAVHAHLGSAVSYGGYLQLDKLLDAQQPLSAEHNEMLFIIVHQVSELWMRLMLHELTAAMECVRRDDLDPAMKMLARISRTQAQLISAWDVLSTMTPFEYSAFPQRARALLRVPVRAVPPAGIPASATRTRKCSPCTSRIRSLRGAASGRLRRLRSMTRCCACSTSVAMRSLKNYLARDFSQPYVPSKQVAGAWLGVYHNSEAHWDLYELAERLMDLDYNFQLWRAHHLKTVERIIGYKPGTGGTAGVAYLAKALELKFFPELWTIRTSL